MATPQRESWFQQSISMKNNCPICNKINDFDRSKIGSMVPCPDCKNIFVLKEILSTATCPDCEEEVESGLRICINCGYNFDTGKKVEKHIPVSGEELPVLQKRLNDLVDFIPGLFKIHILFFFWASIVTACLIMYMGLVLMGFGALLTCIFFGVCALIVYAHGVGFLMTGELQMLRSAMGELTGWRWDFFLILVFGPPITITLIIFKMISLLAP